MKTSTNFNPIKEYIDFRIANVEQKIALLPTKELFLNKMDELYTEMKKITQEHAMLSSQVKRNTQDIKILKDRP